MNRRTRARVVAAGMAIVLVVGLVGGLLSSTSTTNSTDPANTEPELEPLPQASDLAPIGLEELPAEAVETLQLIARGGPYPYDRDGATFQNREGLLPEEPDGYYAEYTVITPGEDDRGARRLVVGDGDEIYYTDDHYESFRELVLG